jgi:S-(hydroxymethyl)glutathione dehydrogenase/alcohol dehydrogenase
MKTRAAVLRKAGTIVITGVGYYDVVLPGGIQEGRSRLTELITKKYTLDEINDGYQDLMDGKNIRGVVVHQH